MSDARDEPFRDGDVRGSVVAATLGGQAGRRALVVAVVISLAWVAVVVAQPDRTDDDAARIRRMTASGCAYDTRHDPGRRHVDAPAYAVDPPAGGDHAPRPADAGIYRGGDVPADGALVHSLEHGLVVVWAGPGLPAADRARLDALHARFPGSVVVADRPALALPLAASAWQRRLLCRDVDVEAVRRFVCAFNGRGPERVRVADRCDDA